MHIIKQTDNFGGSMGESFKKNIRNDGFLLTNSGNLWNKTKFNFLYNINVLFALKSGSFALCHKVICWFFFQNHMEILVQVYLSVITIYCSKSYLLTELHAHILQCQRAEIKKTAPYNPSSHFYSSSTKKKPQPQFDTYK